MTKSKKKGEDGETVTIKLTDKTALAFFAVSAGGAKLEKEMHVSVWLAAGSKDTADRVHAFGPAEGIKKGAPAQKPSLAGPVTAVAADGKSFTIEVEIKLGAATKQVFGNVKAGEARLRVGMKAMVWVDEKDKASATLALFHAGEASTGNVLAGPVTAVAADGKSFTIEVGAKKKGDEARKVEVKLTESTRVLFQLVKADGAKPTVGYTAMILLAPGVKDVGKVEMVQFSAQTK
jgi:hypothetical protein